jgi:hypothetical protein
LPTWRKKPDLWASDAREVRDVETEQAKQKIYKLPEQKLKRDLLAQTPSRLLL